MLKNTQKDSHSTIKADELIKAVFFFFWKTHNKKQTFKVKMGIPSSPK